MDSNILISKSLLLFLPCVAGCLSVTLSRCSVSCVHCKCLIMEVLYLIWVFCQVDLCVSCQLLEAISLFYLKMNLGLLHNNKMGSHFSLAKLFSPLARKYYFSPVINTLQIKNTCLKSSYNFSSHAVPMGLGQIKQI